MNGKNIGLQKIKKGIKPRNLIIADSEPLEIGQVVLLGKFRIKIAKEISKEEFTKELEYNKRQEVYAGYTTDIKDSRIDVDEITIKDDFPEYARYFYTGEII